MVVLLCDFGKRIAYRNQASKNYCPVLSEDLRLVISRTTRLRSSSISSMPGMKAMMYSHTLPPIGAVPNSALPHGV